MEEEQEIPKASNAGCATSVFALLLVSGTVYLVSAWRGPEVTNPDTGIEQKIARLQETESSLQDLVKFVRDQQAKLRESQGVLDSLKSEHEKLKPVVEADRKVVDAVLAAQSERQSVDARSERTIGFVLGVLASLAASLIWYLASKWLSTRRSILPSTAVPHDPTRPSLPPPPPSARSK